MEIVKTEQFERWEREFDGGTQQKHAKKIAKLAEELEQLARPEENRNIVKLHTQSKDGTNLYALSLDGKKDLRNEVIFAIDRKAGEVVLLGGVELDVTHQRHGLAHMPEKYGRMIEAYDQYAAAKAKEAVKGAHTAKQAERAAAQSSVSVRGA